MSHRRSALLAALALTLPLAACVSPPGPAAMLNGTEIVSPPKTAEADAYGNYLSAHLAVSTHDLRDAAKYYRASLDSDPDNADLLSHAFLYMAASGGIGEAAKLAERVVVKNHDDRAARLTLTVESIKERDFGGARMQIAQSARGPFTSLTLTLLDAWAAYGMGKTDVALNDLKELPGQGGTEALAHYHAALMFDLAGRDAEADAAYRAAILASGPSPREVEAYGRFLERTGKAEAAKTFYKQMSGRESLAAIAAAGEARIKAGEKPERLIRNVEDGAAEALFGIAASLTEVTSADIAILYLRLGLYLSPDLDLAKLVLADRFETLEKYQDAIAVYATIAPDSPYRTASSIQAAVDKTRLKQADAAIADLKAITGADVRDVTAWTALGDAYRSVERYSDAADAYDHAVKAVGAAEKRDWPLFYARAISEERARNWNAAETDLKFALKLAPDQPQILNYLGYSWVDRHRNLPEALAMLEKARALSPFDGYIVDSVGWAYYRLGRYKDAAEALEQAVLLVPGDSTINDHLGDAYWKVGRKLEAHFQWNHALTFEPDAGEKKMIEDKLKFGLNSGQGSEGPRH